MRLSSSYERRKHDDRPFGFEVQFEQVTPPDASLGEVAAWGPGDEKGTQRFDAAFQDVKAKITADGIFKEPSRFVRCPRPAIEPTSRATRSIA